MEMWLDRVGVDDRGVHRKRPKPPRFESESEIDLTPMLDVVMILLIFFIVSGTFITEVVIQTDRNQTTNETSSKPSQNINILVTATNRADSAKARRLEEHGVEVIPCRLQRNRVSLRSVLSALARRDVTNLLVEGGPTVLSALLERNLVDEAHVFTAPFLIGGDDATSALGGRGPGALSTAQRPVSSTIRRCGDDVLHILRHTNPPA